MPTDPPATTIISTTRLVDESPCVFGFDANRNSVPVKYRVQLSQYDPAGHFIASLGNIGTELVPGVPQPGDPYFSGNSWIICLDLSVARWRGTDGKVSLTDYEVTAHFGVPSGSNSGNAGKINKPDLEPWKRPISLNGDSSLERVPRETDFGDPPARVLCSGDIPYNNPVLFDECRQHYTLRYNVDPSAAGFDLTAAMNLGATRNINTVLIPWMFLQPGGTLTAAKNLTIAEGCGRILSVRNQEDVWNVPKVTGDTPIDGKVYLKMTVDIEVIPAGFNMVPKLDGTAGFYDIGFDQQITNYNNCSIVSGTIRNTPDGSGKFLDASGVILPDHDQTDLTKRTYKRYETGFNSSWKALFVGLDASVAPTGDGVA